MSHVKIICRLHSQKFYDLNKKYFCNLNQTFHYACDNNYGSHWLFFCICPNCFEEMTNEGYHINAMSNKWVKFCSMLSYLKWRTLYGNEIFLL